MIEKMLIVVMVVSGCSVAPKNIQPSYSSPIQYQEYTCQQLNAELVRIRARISQLEGQLDTAAGNDKMIAVAGALLFWPALFKLGGTKQQEAEYAKLSGDSDAVGQVIITKNC